MIMLTRSSEEIFNPMCYTGNWRCAGCNKRYFNNKRYERRNKINCNNYRDMQDVIDIVINYIKDVIRDMNDTLIDNQLRVYIIL